MGPIPPKIVDAWHTKPPTLFLETNVFPARLPGMLSLDLATFERQPWPTPRVDTLDLSHCWEGFFFFLKLSGWGPLTITHDLLTILELLDVPFGSFTSLKDAFGTSHSRLLTITHDYSRFLFCSVFDLTLQCVVTMRAQSFFLMCHMKTHSSCTPCLNKFEKQSPLLVQHVTRKIPHPLMSKSAINLSSQALPEPGRPRSCFACSFRNCLSGSKFACFQSCGGSKSSWQQQEGWPVVWFWARMMLSIGYHSCVSHPIGGPQTLFFIQKMRHLGPPLFWDIPIYGAVICTCGKNRLQLIAMYMHMILIPKITPLPDHHFTKTYCWIPIVLGELCFGMLWSWSVHWENDRAKIIVPVPFGVEGTGCFP